MLKFSLYFDTQRPNLNITESGRPIEVYQSSHFQSDGYNYTAKIDVLNEYFVNQESTGGSLIPQFQLVRKELNGVISQVNENSWLPFPNISDSYKVNGADFRLYYRQMDLAGNFSDSDFFDFNYDNVAPISPNNEQIEIIQDSGIYNYDRHTKSLEINPLQALYSSTHDELTVLALGQWIRTGSLIDPDLYVINPVSPLLDGDYSFVTLQVDRAGNFSETLRQDYVLDSMAPEFKLFSGLKHRDGNALPLLNYDSSEDSLTEWVQYRLVDVSNLVNQSNTSEWTNISTVDKSGSYDVYSRWIDRAGNAAQEHYLGKVELDFDAPVLNFDQINVLETVSSAGILNWLKDNVLSDDEALITPLVASSRSWLGTALDFTDYFVTARDDSGNISSPFSISSFQDEVSRIEVRVESDSGFFVQANENQATEFISKTASDGLTVFGSKLSDRFSNLNVGDIFFGLGGGDLTLIDSSVKMMGLSFLNPAEIQIFCDAYDDFLTDEQLQELKFSPILKASFEGVSDLDLGGVAIFQSQLARYETESTTEYLAVKWNQPLSRWFVDLGANDDSLYFGGDGINVYGGAGSDLLQGGSGNDYLVAGSNTNGISDTLRGYAGDDILVAGDYLFFSNTSVILDGGTGKDTLVAGNGHSDLTGGAGADLFVISAIDRSNVPIKVEIKDFLPGTDSLFIEGLSEGSAFKGIFVDVEAGNVVIDLTNLLGLDNAPYGSTLTINSFDLSGLLPEDISASWFDFSVDASFEWSDLAIDTLSWS